MLTSLILGINLAFSIVINERELVWADMKYTRTGGSTYSSVYGLDISKVNKDLATDYDTMMFYLKNVKDFPSGINIGGEQDKKEVERFLVELKNIINSRKEKLDDFGIFMSIDNFTDKNLSTIAEIKNVKKQIEVSAHSNGIWNHYKKLEISKKIFDKLNKAGIDVSFNSVNNLRGEIGFCDDFDKEFNQEDRKVHCL
ncbi:hypothetical protein HG430_003630 [Candidatus Gracilibacteria bacterium]|nr:hypothetical protein [Candidatus Gracilibacteria bacterium]